MKRKLFSFVLAFAFIITTAIGLTGCDDEPSLQGILIAKNGEEATVDNISYGNFEVGSTGPTLNYKVYAKYDNGTKTELQSTEYSVVYEFNGNAIDSLPSVYSNTGCYTIKITYKEHQGSVSFNIEQSSTNYIIVTSKTTYQYPEKLVELKINDNTATENDISYYYIAKTFVADKNNPTENELSNKISYSAGLQLDPGSYYVFAEINAHGNYQAGITDLKEITINKGLLLIDDTVKSNNNTFNYAYTNQYIGKATLANINTNYVEATILNYPTDELETNPNANKINVPISFENPTTILNYETYQPGKIEKVVVKLDSNLSKYYNTPAGWDATITVEQAQIEVPTIDIENFNPAGENDIKNLYLYFSNFSWFNSFEIKKGGIPFTPKVESENGDKISLDTITTTGTYSYTLSLKDKENYTWSNSSSNDITLEWEVKELNMAKLKWQVRGSNATNGQSFVLDANNDVFPEIVLPSDVTYDITGYKYYAADNTLLSSYPTEVGSYYVTFDSAYLQANNGHYIITGELARLDYSIVAE